LALLIDYYHLTRVEEQSSRGENMILEILASQEMEQVGSLSPQTSSPDFVQF